MPPSVTFYKHEWVVRGLLLHMHRKFSWQLPPSPAPHSTTRMACFLKEIQRKKEQVKEKVTK